jgi:hypothetical protein
MKLTFKTQDDHADVTFNQLLGINNAGEIAGYFGNGQTRPNKGYVLKPPYAQADYTNENFIGSTQTQVTGVNNHGVTVGFWVDGTGDNYGFVKDGSQWITAIDPHAPAPTATAPVMEQFLGINDHNIAVGFYADAKGHDHGFTYDVKTGSFDAVSIKGFSQSTAAAINNKGEIAGFVSNGGNDDGFIKNGNKIELLTGPTGAVSVQALGINNEDEVVGSYEDKTKATFGFLYNEHTGQYTTISDPNTPVNAGPATMTVINGLNDKGQLVGFYLDSGGITEGLIATLSAHK